MFPNEKHLKSCDHEYWKIIFDDTQIISGYQLPKKKGDKKKSILDPYVKVEVLGVDQDAKSERTDYIHNNGTYTIQLGLGVRRLFFNPRPLSIFS